MADNVVNIRNSATVTDVTLAVLAGGRGTRMGTPKALLRVGDHPLLSWLLDRWNWPGPTMLVTAPGIEHPPGFERFMRECVDPVADEGPLRGVLTALEHVATDRIVVTTCDMPMLEPAHFVELLQEFDHRAECIGVMCRRTDDHEKIIEPFPMALDRESLGFIRAAFDAGERSPAALSGPRYSRPAVDVIECDWPPNVWTNLNRPADLAAFQRYNELGGS